MKVICFDPGVTTGYAVGHIVTGEPMGVVSGQYKWDELGIYHALGSGKPDIIIYERFEYRSQAAYNVTDAELFPRNLIGVINLYCQQNNIKPYTQMPSYALGKKAYFTDKRLQEVGVYKATGPHANDAMRHLLQWYTFGAGYYYQPNKEGYVSLA